MEISFAQGPDILRSNYSKAKTRANSHRANVLGGHRYNHQMSNLAVIKPVLSSRLTDLTS